MNERTPKKITAAVLAAVLAVGSVPATTLATTVAAFAAETTAVAASVTAMSAGIDGTYAAGAGANVPIGADMKYPALAPAAAASGNKIKVKFADLK